MIHGTNMELTPAIKAFIEEKVGRIEDMLQPKDSDLAEVRVEVGRPSKHHHTGAVHRSEINMKIGGNLIRAEAMHEDLYAAVNLTRDEIERQLRKVKTKVASKRRQLRTTK
jgi:ribosomal subunit interface protein